MFDLRQLAGVPSLQEPDRKFLMSAPVHRWVLVLAVFLAAYAHGKPVLMNRFPDRDLSPWVRHFRDGDYASAHRLLSDVAEVDPNYLDLLERTAFVMHPGEEASPVRSDFQNALKGHLRRTEAGASISEVSQWACGDLWLRMALRSATEGASLVDCWEIANHAMRKLAWQHAGHGHTESFERALEGLSDLIGLHYQVKNGEWFDSILSHRDELESFGWRVFSSGSVTGQDLEECIDRNRPVVIGKGATLAFRNDEDFVIPRGVQVWIDAGAKVTPKPGSGLIVIGDLIVLGGRLTLNRSSRNPWNGVALEGAGGILSDLEIGGAIVGVGVGNGNGYSGFTLYNLEVRDCVIGVGGELPGEGSASGAEAHLWLERAFINGFSEYAVNSRCKYLVCALCRFDSRDGPAVNLTGGNCVVFWSEVLSGGPVLRSLGDYSGPCHFLLRCTAGRKDRRKAVVEYEDPRAIVADSVYWEGGYKKDRVFRSIAGAGKSHSYRIKGDPHPQVKAPDVSPGPLPE